MTVLPLALKLEGEAVLVIGAGAAAAFKIQQLLAASARVVVVAREVLVALPEGVERVERRDYRPGDLEGYRLVIAAVGVDEVNELIVAEARERHVWLNVVDDPGRSDFYFMALHRAGEVAVAVTTEGAAPALAQELRDVIAASLPANVAEVAATLREERRHLHEQGESTEGRPWRARVRELLGLEERGTGLTRAR